MGPAALVSRRLLQESACHDCLIWIEPGNFKLVFHKTKSPGTIPKLKAKTSLEVGVPRRWHPKNTGSSPCQHLGIVGCFLQICSQGLHDDTANSSLPRQSETVCKKSISGLCEEMTYQTQMFLLFVQSLDLRTGIFWYEFKGKKSLTLTVLYHGITK